MPNIKSISTDSDGNVTITPVDTKLSALGVVEAKEAVAILDKAGKPVLDKEGKAVTTITAREFVREDIIKEVEDELLGLLDNSHPDFDKYTHCYEDLTMKNPKRTATLVCNKGYVPPKNWWINEVMTDGKPI